MEKVREKFSPESYEALDIVMGTDDDLDDDGWRALLTA